MNAFLLPTRPTTSSYLITPQRANRQPWGLIQTALIRLNRHRADLIFRTAIALLLWTTGNVGLNYLRHQPLLPAPAATAAGLPAASPAATPATVKLASTATAAAHPATLGGDATGWMLPPIYMAPAGTYLNNYSWGQCTWYVAGRRRIPSNWGNANNWYYDARAAGWSTGTIPAVGAIAWTAAGTFGHVALVENISADYTKVYVAEMNYAGLDVISHRWVPIGSFRYIYQQQTP